jgi:hypothetical protein
MIRVTITPRATADIYGILVKKEVELRRKNTGTLHRKGAKKRGEDKWTHTSYPGWIRFRQGLGGVAMAAVQSKSPNEEWQLLSSLIGFLDRHFRSEIANITISYATDE